MDQFFMVQLFIGMKKENLSGARKRAQRAHQLQNTIIFLRGIIS